MVIIVFGLPGSGKSYFASRLAKKLGAIYVNSDELRMKLLAVRNYTDAEKLFVYDQMLKAMTEAITKKKPIVLDATFYREAIRTKFEQAAYGYQEQIIYIEVTAAEELVAERVSRPRKHSEADFDIYLKLKAAFEPLQQEHLVLVSSKNDITPNLEQAIAYINRNYEKKSD